MTQRIDTRKNIVPPWLRLTRRSFFDQRLEILSDDHESEILSDRIPTKIHHRREHRLARNTKEDAACACEGRLWISGRHENLTCYVVGARSIRTERPRLRDPKRWVDDTQGGGVEGAVGSSRDREWGMRMRGIPGQVVGRDSEEGTPRWLV